MEPLRCEKQEKTTALLLVCTPPQRSRCEALTSTICTLRYYLYKLGTQARTLHSPSHTLTHAN